MFNIGPTELLVILVVALIVFGPKRLPDVGRTMGKSLRELRRATDDLKGQIQGTLDDDDWDNTQPQAGPAPGDTADASAAEASSMSPNGKTAVDDEAVPGPPGTGGGPPSEA